MVSPVSRSLLSSVPRQGVASTSRLGPSAAQRFLSSSRLSKDEVASSASTLTPEPPAWTSSPSAQWQFDTDAPLGGLFNAAGSKAVRKYHQHLLSSIRATTERLASIAQADERVRNLRKSTVLSIAATTSAPLDLWQTKPLLPEISNAEQVEQQKAIEEYNKNVDKRNATRLKTIGRPWDRLFAESCEAVNHNFFLSSLRSLSDPVSYPHKVEEHIIASFGSNSGFEQTVLGHAEGMTSSGWLWLVQERNGGTEDLAVVATYGAGTLLVQDGQPIRGRSAQDFRHMGLNDQGQVFQEDEARTSPAAASSETSLGQRTFSTSPSTSAEEASSSRLRHHVTQPSAFGTGASQREGGAGARGGPRPTNLLTAANELVPLACLSLHEHAFVPTHGVWGKRAYVETWLSALDWEKIDRRMVEPRARVVANQYF